MRVSALIQISTMAACPLALLALNDTGDSRVPAPPAPSPLPSQATSPTSAPAIPSLPTSVAPPEAFALEATEHHPLPLKTPALPTPALSFLANPVLPEPTLLTQSLVAETPAAPATPKPSARSNPLNLSNQPASVPQAIAAPENLNLPWDRIVARSVGLDERTFAAVSRAATASTAAPAATAPSAAPAKAVAPPEAVAPLETGAEPRVLDAAAVSATLTLPTPELSGEPSPIPSAELPPVEPDADPTTDTILVAAASPLIGSEAQLASIPATEQTAAEPTLSAATEVPTPPAVQPDVQPQIQPDDQANVQPAQPATQPAPTILATTPPSAMPPSAVLPVPALDPSYRLGPGDQIQVNFFNVPEYSGPQRVLVDGTVNLPVVGSVSVTGLTLSQAEQTIAAAFSRELRNIRVTVSLAQARPLQIGVAGEVQQPGYYVLTSSDAQLPSVAQAIQTAGGVTQLADLRQVQIRRIGPTGAPETITVNLWALLEQGDLSQNLTLLDGDTIVVTPTSSLNAAETEQLAASNLAANEAQSVNVALVGEVGRPGAYRLESAVGNRPTLTQAIQAAGGVTPEANLRKVQVQRTARNGTVQTTTLDLWQLVTTGDLSQDLVLQPGDRITIAKAEAMTPEEMARVTGSNVSPSTININIVGEATSPGSVQVPANTTLNQALLAAGGLNRRARRTVQLIRINPNGTLTQRSIQVDWDRPVDPETNPILHNNDVVLVGRTTLASITDGAADILEPIFRILPIFRLF